MKAFVISPPSDDRFSRADGVCEYYLPQLKCEKCESDWRTLGRVPPTNPSVWSVLGVWYPTLKIVKDCDPSAFNQNDVISKSELMTMRRLIVGRGVSDLQLPPGSGIGMVTARIPRRATDIVWCGFSLLMSFRAISICEQAGISLEYAPVIPLKSSTDIKYFALQLDPKSLYSQHTLKEMTLESCTMCGQYWMRDVRATVKEAREYRKEAIRSSVGLVRAAEGLETLATDLFMDVVNSEKLTGIQFREFGVLL